MLEITSTKNPHIKEAISLGKKRNRDSLKLFLIEGYRELFYASQESQKIQTLFICKELFLGPNEDKLIHHLEKQGAKIISCPEAVFKKISYRERPDGLLAVAPQQKKTLIDLSNHLKEIKNPFIIVAQSIEKPGNLGTILRSADASGAAGVIICDRCTDIYNPNVVRASTGTLFTLPVIEATSDEVFVFLQDHGFEIAAATPSATDIFTSVDLTKKIAIAVGTEQYGLTDTWLKKANIQVKIPMMGKADSLNVSSATTLLLYEALRQRSNSISR